MATSKSADVMSVSEESNNPSESQVVKHLMDWINVAYRYYASKDATATVPQTMDKLSEYLSTVSAELRANGVKGRSTDTGISTDAQKSEVSEKKDNSEKQPEVEKSQLPAQQDDLAHTGKVSLKSAAKPLAKSTEMQNNAESSAKRELAKTAAENDCRICLESVTGRYGVLENCDHSYCETCLRSWIRENPNQSVKCPTCRVLSPRVLIRDHFLHGAEKIAQFESMLCCVPHQLESNEQEQEQEQEDPEDHVLLIPQFEQEFEDAAQYAVEIEDEPEEIYEIDDLDDREISSDQEWEHGEPIVDDSSEESSSMPLEEWNNFEVVVMTDAEDSEDTSTEQSDSSLYFGSEYEDATSSEGTSDDDGTTTDDESI